MNRTVISLCFAVGLTAVSVQNANAQGARCAPRENVIDHLSDRFGEARQSIGLASGNRVIEMFASDETGSWTLTMTTPDGKTCIIAAGQSFERTEEVAVPTGQPT